MIRAIISLFAAFALLTPPAAAQQSQAQQQALAPTHVAAAAGALEVLLGEGDTLSHIARMSWMIVAPSMREGLQATPFYASLTPARQAALINYIERQGAEAVREEAFRALPSVIKSYAPRLAMLFTEAELADITAYMRSPEGVAVWTRSMIETIDAMSRGDAPPAETLSEPEAAARARFEQTPGGGAFAARAAEFGALMREVGGAITGAPNVDRRLRSDMCAVVGPQCPAGWRVS